MALNTLEIQQFAPTTQTKANINKFCDFLTTHPGAKIKFFASDMLLQVHSDASFMNEIKTRSIAAGIFFLGNKINPNMPIYLNGPIHVLCKVLDKIAASAAETELGSLFLNVQETIKFKIALEKLGHP